MFKRSLILTLIAALLVGIIPAANAQEGGATTFTIRLTNLTAPLPITETAVFNTPVDAMDAGPVLPGAAYAFDVHGVPGDVLSFATMLVQSNDLFFAPQPAGIALFDDTGAPISGDITGNVLLWDAGTEVNEEPGVGPNQAPRQAGPNTGDDEMGPVALISDVADGFTYPTVSEYIRVTIVPHTDDMMDGDMADDDMADNEMAEDDMMNEAMMEGYTGFTVTVENISADSSLAGPIAPGVFAAHSPAISLFTVGAPASRGLEALAEDGNPALLGNTLGAVRFATPISPVVYVVHPADVQLFNLGDVASAGLEGVAEDGNPAVLVEEITAAGLLGGTQPIAFDATEAGPAGPNSGYEFSVTANPGDVITIVTMFVQSNDWFLGVNSLPLFNEDGTPTSGDFSGQLYLWDAGTEVNEPLGEGPNQAPRQAGPNTGEAENATITQIAPSGDMMMDDMSGDDMSGDDMSSDDMSGDDMSGDDMSGDDMSGDDMSGDDMGMESMNIVPSIHYNFQLTITAQ